MTELQFHKDTPEAVRKIITGCLHTPIRLRLYFGDTKTGRCWLEDRDILGTIGQSTGSKPIPLLINNQRSMGGPHILDYCIIAIQRIEDHRWLYRHPKFYVRDFSIKQGDDKQCPWEVFGDEDGCEARFPTEKKAQHWIEFMQGKRFTVA